MYIKVSYLQAATGRADNGIYLKIHYDGRLLYSAVEYYYYKSTIEQYAVYIDSLW